MPIVTFPENPEIWSEGLNPLEGYWFSGAYNGSVHRDIAIKASGQASIRHEGGDYDAPATLIFELYQTFDATGKTEPKFTLIHKLGSAVNFTGYCRVYLVDANGAYVWKEFGTAPGGPFEFKEWNLGSEAGWVAVGLFDWSKIKRIEIYAEGFDSFWVDRPYFSWVVTLPTLKITSEPTGKHFSIDEAVSGYTPAQYQINPDTPYTVSIDPTGFEQWEDNSVNPIRTIILAQGEVKTITAYYEGAPPNGDGDIIPLLVAAGVAITIPLILALMLE